MSGLTHAVLMVFCIVCFVVALNVFGVSFRTRTKASQGEARYRNSRPKPTFGIERKRLLL